MNRITVVTFPCCSSLTAAVENAALTRARSLGGGGTALCGLCTAVKRAELGVLHLPPPEPRGEICAVPEHGPAPSCPELRTGLPLQGTAFSETKFAEQDDASCTEPVAVFFD